MVPTDWAFECWGYLAVVMGMGSPEDWWQDASKVQLQDGVLSQVVRPTLSGRRWFFRRRGLDHEVAPVDLPNSLGIHVKLQRGLPRADPQRDLEALRMALTAAGHQVVIIGCWDRCYGDGYGGPLGQAALREFCCDATEAFLSGGDAYAAAQRWLAEGTACAPGIAHWLSWITGDPNESAVRARLGLR